MNTSTNYREVLKKNSRKTMFVMGLFILIYLIVGIIIDLVIQSSVYHGMYSLGELFIGLVTFAIIPYATIIFVAVALISIAITLMFHNQIMLVGTEYKEITSDNAASLLEKQIYNTVEEMKIAAGMNYMPKVFIINAGYMNAFASGFNEKNAMIAITAGLAQKLSRDELQAVLAHELSHIRHGDIKLTIVASILSNLMLMIIDILFWSAIFGSNNRNSRNDRDGNQLMLIVMLLKFILPIVTVLLMLFLSRSREYMADSGAVELMRDNTPMARALMKIAKDHEHNRAAYTRAYQSAPGECVRHQAYIFDPVQAGISSGNSIGEMFSTHPTIENRLRELGYEVSGD